MTHPDLDHTLNTFAKDCDWLGLRYVRELTQRRSLRDGKPEGNHVELQRGLMMEVAADGGFAYAATSDLSPTGLRQCFLRGRALAQGTAACQLTPFSPHLRGSTQARYRGPSERALSSASLQEVVSLMSAASGALLKVPNALSSSVNLMLIEHTTRYITSDGANIEQSFDMLSEGMSITARKNNITQTRSDGGFQARCRQGGLEGLNREDLLQRAAKIGAEVNQLLEADNCPADRMDLLLMPNQMLLQIHESIGHPLELDRILGDERNYAGWSFVQPGDFGQLQYGSPLLNVVFEPNRTGEFASYAFDDTGNAATPVHLIKDGLLLAGLGGAESQARSGIPGVANVRAQSWNRPPIDRLANINLLAGQSSLAQMIAAVERGILMDTNRSWSIDDYRNKFQFGCEYGQLIENGELTRLVRNPNYRSTTLPFWRGLKMLGDTGTYETYGTPYCGKGEPNQVIRVGHAAPAALFSDVEVFGGAA